MNYLKENQNRIRLYIFILNLHQDFLIIDTLKVKNNTSIIGTKKRRYRIL